MWLDRRDPDGGIDAEWVRKEVVDEPYGADENESGAVIFQRQQIWHVLLQIIASIGLGLLHLESQVD